MSLHSAQTANHRLESWVYADATARLAATGFVAEDVGKIAYQTDAGAYYRLMDDSPITWRIAGEACRTYCASLTQVDTSAPVATVWRSTLDGPIVWSYVAVGAYLGTLTNGFVSEKVFLAPALCDPSSLGDMSFYFVQYASHDSIVLYTCLPTTVQANDLLFNIPIRIDVYE